MCRTAFQSVEEVEDIFLKFEYSILMWVKQAENERTFYPWNFAAVCYITTNH